jgi:rRNA maturation RNase YbeY
MISFHSELDFELEEKEILQSWIEKAILNEAKKLGELNYIFLTDDALLKINQEHLQHDYYTDIISFDYTLGSIISGDMFISIDRIRDNASQFSNTFKDELHRVMIHGVLHYCGYKDKLEDDIKEMRTKEDYYLSLRPN